MRCAIDDATPAPYARPDVNRRVACSDGCRSIAAIIAGIIRPHSIPQIAPASIADSHSRKTVIAPTTTIAAPIAETSLASCPRTRIHRSIGAVMLNYRISATADEGRTSGRQPWHLLVLIRTILTRTRVVIRHSPRTAMGNGTAASTRTTVPRRAAPPLRRCDSLGARLPFRLEGALGAARLSPRRRCAERQPVRPSPRRRPAAARTARRQRAVTVFSRRGDRRPVDRLSVVSGGHPGESAVAAAGRSGHRGLAHVRDGVEGARGVARADAGDRRVLRRRLLRA